MMLTLADTKATAQGPLKSHENVARISSFV